ncbi:nucleotidyltransferase domain-containing protein [bacterium]|nr:nucleotidyltransferase domain-containing protein [bacterium]
MSSPLEKAIEIIIRVADPDRIILFGSRSRGDYKKESDYDLCIIKKGVEHRRRLAQQIYRYLYGIGASVDVIVETPERFEELKDNLFMVYKKIAMDGKVIYDKPDFS